MKIIKNNVTSQYPKKCICNNCKSILEIVELDIIQIKIDGYDPRDNEPYSYKTAGYKCPCCNKNTEIKENK